MSAALKSKKEKFTNDLTVGKPLKKILSFTVPIFIGNLFQQLYSMVDAIIVGRTVGLSALAAVGATGAVSFLIIGFVTGVTSGFTVLTAQKFGAGDADGVRKSAAASLVLSVLVTVALTAVAVLTAKPLLRLMNTPEDILEDAYNYIVVIDWGIAAATFYNLVSNLVRALGDSRTPLVFLIFASVLNVGLDFLTILVFRMGVAGAAWATVVSQAAAGALCLIYALKKYPLLRVRKSDFKLPFAFYLRHLKVGLPMAFQFSITAVGVMVIQSVLNGFGSTVVAAYTAASKIDNLATQSLLSLGTAMATFCAQNYGAGKFARIKEGIRKANVTSVAFSVSGFALIMLLEIPLTRLFVGADAETVANEVHLYLLINGASYVFLGVLFVLRSSVQGLGYSGTAMFAGVAELAMRILAAFLFAALWGYIGVCTANPVAWFGADVFLIVVYLRITKKRLNVAEYSQPMRQIPLPDKVLPGTVASDEGIFEFTNCVEFTDCVDGDSAEHSEAAAPGEASEEEYALAPADCQGKDAAVAES